MSAEGPAVSPGRPPPFSSSRVFPAASGSSFGFRRPRRLRFPVSLSGSCPWGQPRVTLQQASADLCAGVLSITLFAKVSLSFAVFIFFFQQTLMNFSVLLANLHLVRTILVPVVIFVSARHGPSVRFFELIAFRACALSAQ